MKATDTVWTWALTERETELWKRLNEYLEKIRAMERKESIAGPSRWDSLQDLAVYYFTKSHGLRWVEDDGRFHSYGVDEVHDTEGSEFALVRRAEPEGTLILHPNHKALAEHHWHLFRTFWELVRECEYK